MAKVRLEIISPYKVVYSEDIDLLIARTTAGEIGIMAQHIPLVAGLVPHAMRIMIDGNEKLIAIGGGFIEVQPDKITILASTAELPIDIDINRARRAYEEAKKLLDEFERKPKDVVDIDTIRLRAALERAKARLIATKTDVG